jgi:hypothetical protein
MGWRTGEPRGNRQALADLPPSHQNCGGVNRESRRPVRVHAALAATFQMGRQTQLRLRARRRQCTCYLSYRAQNGGKAMGTFWFLLLAAGVVVVVLAVSLALAQARERHKQEMRDLIRGRKPSHPLAPFEDNGKAEAAAIPARRAYPPLSNANPLAPVDESMVSRAEQLHRELLAEVDSANRGPTTRSRKPGPCTLRIDYVDADGVMTTRTVSPYKSDHTNEKMEAWCELRQERRTFFFSRIHYAIHISTGQQLHCADVFRLIHPSRSPPEGICNN